MRRKSPFIQYLRTQPVYASTVIVVLSRNQDTLGHLHEHLIGARSFLVKPFLPQDLLSVIQRNVRVTRTT